MKNSNPRKTYLNFRNSLLTLYKNDSSRFTILKIILRLLLDSLAFAKLFVESGPKHAFAIIHAHLSFYKVKKKRPKRNQVNLQGMYHRSIVMEYFLRGKKKYTQLK